MTPSLRIAPMTPGDLGTAIDWAAAEGWNPGLEDAAAFLAADPAGFLMGWLADEPVTAISVVRHSDSFGFLGFYLCRPEFRGGGYGMTTWVTGMDHLGARTVGLDGVPAQQSNYESSGFSLAHHTRRHSGNVRGVAHEGVRRATARDIPVMLELDRRIGGADRVPYFSAWVGAAETRLTLVAEEQGQISAIGTIRTCREGHKIGPLFAPDADLARRLIESLVAAADAQAIMIDVPDPNADGVELAGELGLEPVFSCARMYRGAAPARDLPRIFGETTFELG